MMGTIGVMAVNPAIYRDVGYDPAEDFVPVARLVSFANILVVHPSLPVRSVAEFVALARSRPGGRMTYGAGCELADRILAIAPVSGGTRALPPCHPARPISVLDVHGTSDQIVSYDGRGPDHDGRVRDVLAGWAEREATCPASGRRV